MSIDDKNSYEEVRTSLEKVADAENKSELSEFVLTSEVIKLFLKNRFN